jgi:hypothetical protein
MAAEGPVMPTPRGPRRGWLAGTALATLGSRLVLVLPTSLSGDLAAALLEHGSATLDER